MILQIQIIFALGCECDTPKDGLKMKETSKSKTIIPVEIREGEKLLFCLWCTSEVWINFMLSDYLCYLISCDQETSKAEGEARGA